MGMIQGFSEWVNESKQDPGRWLRTLKDLKRLVSLGLVDSQEYLRAAGQILTDLGKIQSDVETQGRVDDQDEPAPDYWLGWAQGWHGAGVERISLIEGNIDSRGAGEFTIRLNTGLECRVTFTQEAQQRYRMEVEVQVGSESFRKVTEDLAESGMDWTDTTDILDRVLEWAVNKYGPLALDLLIGQLA